MKKFLIRSLLLSTCSITSMTAIAGDIDIVEILEPPRVDIPDTEEVWGIGIEGMYLRPYNNNLGYSALTNSLLNTSTGTTYINGVVRTIDPSYNWGLRATLYHVLGDSGNLAKLSYEQFFGQESHDQYIDLQIPQELSGEVRLKFRAISLTTEQHMLIGPYWEAAFVGGLRYAHLEQDLEINDVINVSGMFENFYTFSPYTLKFDGVGPLLGIGSLFHLGNGFSVGAEGLATLFVGNNRIDVHETENSFNICPSSLLCIAPSDTITFTDYDLDNTFSLVPELYYRIYANYFYHFDDGTEIELEAGWRANQFFNMRTRINGVGQPDAFHAASVVGVKSDDIGFSGPYAMVHVNFGN